MPCDFDAHAEWGLPSAACPAEPDIVHAFNYGAKALIEKSGELCAAAIAVRGKRSLFGIGDEKELAQLGLRHERTIDVDTKNWWRLLYNPLTNEIWIDIKDKKLLTKYKGF